MARATRLILGALMGAIFIIGPSTTAMALPQGPSDLQATTHLSSINTLPSKPKPETYVVRSGDSLSAIGAKIGRTWQQLAGWNKLTNPNVILRGQILKIPAVSYVPPLVPQVVYAPTPIQNTRNVPKKYVSATSVGGWSWPWSCIASGESGGNPSENTGNGYWGGLQFAPSTWWSFASKLGITVPAYEASIAQQEAVASLVLASGGWGQWPNTSRACGF